MRITVKLFATLRKGRFEVKEMDFPEGATPAKVTKSLDIPEEESAIVFVNGRNAEMDRVLHDGDILAIFPPVGGG